VGKASGKDYETMGAQLEKWAVAEGVKVALKREGKPSWIFVLPSRRKLVLENEY
jgi:hypothetical protein